MLLRSLILFVIAAAFVLLAVRRLRQHSLKERHALVFILTSLPIFVLAIWPSLLGLIVSWTGIAASTIMLMGVCVFFVYMILELLSLVSKLDQRVSTLAQIVGIQNEREQTLIRRSIEQRLGDGGLTPPPQDDPPLD